jgi:chromosome segregation protein
VDIDALRIVGFKSFADPVEIPIGKGVTGIVGPNGCGKSNLIEALRWAMGETSAKRMRADGMDDVIFGGTDKRMPRSSAEVTIFIDNSSRKAPVEFNSDDRLDVSRRISRGEGSVYKVNAKAARAKDVQVLFKDAGVGAGSSALVSQGKVASIINAKPVERRNILEEAAGVAGLSSRRHEAELRLKGTEQNLERADDLEKNLNDQVGALRRQARQAKRRRDIDGMVRSAEATVLLVRWHVVEAKLADGRLNFDNNEALVKQLMIALQTAEETLQKAEEVAEPAIRAKAEAETALALAKAKVEMVKKEAQASKNALSSAMKLIERTRSDIARQKSEFGNAGEEYDELKDRLAITIDDRDYDKVLIEEENIKAVEAKQALDGISDEVSRLGEALVGARTERAAVERRVLEIKQRRSSTEQKILDSERKLDEANKNCWRCLKLGKSLNWHKKGCRKPNV